jgi:hypothetical protein
MVKTLTAYTDEIDDVEYAVEEIKGQIDFDNDLLRNSVGVVSCLPAHVESGVLKAVCDAVPFDVVGITTIGSTVPGIDTLTPLTLLVLTADDVSFKAAWTEPVLTEDASIIKSSFEQTAAGTEETPKLILTYVPLSMAVGGDFYIKAIDEAAKGAPCFGPLAVDDTIDYHKSQIIFNGETDPNRVAYVFISGNVAPEFYLATISQEKISKDVGVVTKSDGVQLIEINDISVNEFLVSQGLKLNSEGVFEGVNSFPYIVDYGDGAEPVIRVMFAVTPEGRAICGGAIPEGATLSVGYFDRNEILKSTDDAVKKINIDANTHGFLAYSCIGRYFNLEYDPEAESEKVRNYLEPTGIPFQFSYGGGEICPVAKTDGSGTIVNRYHNCTMIACVL